MARGAGADPEGQGGRGDSSRARGQGRIQYGKGGEVDPVRQGRIQ